jgi:hypothetical protein
VESTSGDVVKKTKMNVSGKERVVGTPESEREGKTEQTMKSVVSIPWDASPHHVFCLVLVCFCLPVFGNEALYHTQVPYRN